MRAIIGEADEWNLVGRRKGQAYNWHCHPLSRVGDSVDVVGVRDELIKGVYHDAVAQVVQRSVSLELSNHFQPHHPIIVLVQSH